MQPGNFPPNPYSSSPPFAPRASPFSPYSPNFLRPKGPRFWQPSMRSSTPRNQFQNFQQYHSGDTPNSSGNSPLNSPRGSSNSDTDYLPLNSSHDDSSEQERNGWNPKWKRRKNTSLPWNRFSSEEKHFQPNRSFERPRGRGGYQMNNTSGRAGNSSFSENIQNYVSPSCLQDPWKDLMMDLENKSSTASSSPAEESNPSTITNKS